jgi:hypothetical protein
MNEWNIQSRAHACQACEKHFTDKQHYHTTLLDLKHEIQRRDLCEACWKQEHGEGAADRKGFISHWQGVYEAPPPAPPEPIQKENAESLLRKLMELNDPKYAAAAYILAAMLERKRILKVKEQFKREGQRIFVYEHSRTGDVFTIPDADQQLNDEAVQRDVAALLEHGLNPPVSVEASAAALETEASAGAAEVPSTATPEESVAEPAPAEAEPVAR